MSRSSNRAFAEITDKLPEKRKEVFIALKNRPNSTFYDIAYWLGWNVNKVSNRINELLNSGLIEKTGIEVRGKFEREKYSVITDRKKIIERQQELYVCFTASKNDLEGDYRLCQSEYGKQLIAKRIRYMKDKISSLKEISV